jgi:hypothetical protein
MIARMVLLMPKTIYLQLSSVPLVAGLLRLLCGIVLCTGLVPTALAASADDLKGLSIEVDWTAETTFIRDGVTRSKTDQRSVHLYVGQRGHIFRYGGFGGNRDKSVTSFNQARTYLPNQMAAFTIVNGNLTQIFKLTKGFAVQTITVNPSLDACSFSEIYKPGADGKMMGFDPVTQTPFELVSRTVRSYTCTVKKGNVFGTES